MSMLSLLLLLIQCLIHLISLLFWSMPKFDELKAEEKRLYHNNRESYHRVVEKSGEGLEYARSGTVGETWVPLSEKAYAKLHGDYA